VQHKSVNICFSKFRNNAISNENKRRKKWLPGAFSANRNQDVTGKQQNNSLKVKFEVLESGHSLSQGWTHRG